MDEKNLQPSPPAAKLGDAASHPGLTQQASSKDLDETYELYQRQDVSQEFLDKSSINFAVVFGLKKGTNLQNQDYAWLSSIFYFGYLFAQYPAGYLLQRLPTAKFIGSTIIVWGVLLITTPACTNFAGIAANRFLLGVSEAVVNPGFVLVMSMWYRGAEQPLRLVAYYSMNGVAGIFGGLLGYAIGHITSGPLPGQWMYIFLIFGAVSLAWGVVFLVWMPDLPSRARFLAEDERVVAVERVAANRQGVKNHHFKTYQMWQCLRDLKTWILFVMSIAAQIPNASQSSFQSTILETFGFDALETQYMQIPGSAVLVGLDPGSDGTHNKWGRLVALWLCSLQSVGFSLSLTMVSSNVAGYTKKQLTGAFVFVGYCVGNIIGPQTFIEKEAPLYTSAYIAVLTGYSIKTIVVAVLYFYMWAVNRKRDREVAEAGQLSREEEKQAIELGMQDVTELDNKGFRYSL
ncbi:hypothetical protein PG997_007919 [Apiospora hydei]|uniref:Allantoate permease n=1 Tax=Apiospora hydei TaxID=1337664 RepID=A0ABR1W9F5_9PEZI